MDVVAAVEGEEDEEVEALAAAAAVVAVVAVVAASLAPSTTTRLRCRRLRVDCLRCCGVSDGGRRRREAKQGKREGGIEEGGGDTSKRLASERFASQSEPCLHVAMAISLLTC